jgi:hypothetical protein
MKRILYLALAAASLSLAAMAADFTGYISDSNCAAKQGAKAASDAHANCAASCIKRGASAVLVTPDGKVYKLDDQAKVVDHAGQKVTVTGKLEGDTIRVDSVKM